MSHSPLERVGNYPMKIGSILNFEEWTIIANTSSTNLRKAEFFLSIRSKVMSPILTVFYRVFVNFTLCKMLFKLSLLIFSIPVFDAKLNSASNGDSFKGEHVAKIWEFRWKYCFLPFSASISCWYNRSLFSPSSL